MKHMLKRISMLLMVFMLSVNMVACSNAKDDASESNKNQSSNNTDVTSKYDDAVSLARSDVANADTISREDIEKAINYINEYGAKEAGELDDEHWHKLVYYSTWLQEVGQKTGTSIDHDFMGLATSVQGYAKYNWVEGSSSDDKAKQDARSALDDSLKAIENDGDGLIDSFKELIEGNNNTKE